MTGPSCPPRSRPAARRWFRFLRGCGLGLAIALLPARASDTPKESKDRVITTDSRTGGLIDSILPTAWQKHPRVKFSVITEMTPEGRKRRTPTSDNPVRYFGSSARFAETGWAVGAGTKSPPAAELEEALRKALAGNGYLPLADPNQVPEIVLFFGFGVHETDPLLLATDDEAARMPDAPEELLPLVVRDPTLFRDVVERARFVAGEKFALALKSAIDGEIRNMSANAAAARVPGDYPMRLPVGADFGSPFDTFMRSGNRDTMLQFADMAFHTCYFVLASAYDFNAMTRREKVLLWRTRMAVVAQGVAIQEILRPMVASTGIYLGRETPEAVIVERRLDREGRVEIGTPTVVEEAKPGAASSPSGPR